MRAGHIPVDDASGTWSNGLKEVDRPRGQGLAEGRHHLVVVASEACRRTDADYIVNASLSVGHPDLENTVAMDDRFIRESES